MRKLIITYILYSIILIFLLYIMHYYYSRRRLMPITFSIPEEKLVSNISEKTKLISDLIPGKKETYIYNTEQEYKDEYKKSIFAITIKKAGWDCLRHYEIIANGAIPYFPGIEECPRNTMALYPKYLQYEANTLYNRLKTESIDTLSDKDKQQCYNLANKFLNYTRNTLTTKKMAEHVLEKSNHRNIDNCLFLSGETTGDYLRCLTLHGFKSVLGSKCHDYPKIEHIYKSNTIDFKKLYGKGYNYTNLLDQELHDASLDNGIEEQIERRQYDIIIYGSYHRGMPYYDLVMQYYNPEDIILLCGEDIHDCNYKEFLDKGHWVFVREL
jgi:hypothetical protein